MTILFCDACGDQVTAVHPCKFVFHDRLTINLNICPDCMKYGKLEIDLPRKRLVSIVLNHGLMRWKQRVRGDKYGNV